MVKFAWRADFDNTEIKLDLPLLVVDDDFFDYLEDETDYDGGAIELDEFLFYYFDWESKNVEYAS